MCICLCCDVLLSASYLCTLILRHVNAEYGRCRLTYYTLMAVSGLHLGCARRNWSTSWDGCRQNNGTTVNDMKAEAFVFLLLINGDFNRVPFAHIATKEWLLQVTPA